MKKQLPLGTTHTYTVTNTKRVKGDKTNSYKMDLSTSITEERSLTESLISQTHRLHVIWLHVFIPF